MDGHHRDIGKDRMRDFLSIVTCVLETQSQLDLRNVTLERVSKYRLEFSEEKMQREEQSIEGEEVIEDEKSHVLIRKYPR